MQLYCLLLLICVNNLWSVVKPLPPRLMVFGEILLNKMWLSHTCPPFLSAGWNVNTSKGDSVLAPVFTEREIAKPQHMYLVQFKSPFWARVPNVFVPVAFFWNDKLFEKDSLYLSSPLVFKGWFKGLYCLLTAARICVREGRNGEHI